MKLKWGWMLGLVGCLGACDDTTDTVGGTGGTVSSGGTGGTSGGGGMGGGTGGGGTGGDAGAGGGGGTAQDQLDTWCDTFAAAYCPALFACCTDQEVLDMYGGTITGCQNLYQGACFTKGDAKDIADLVVAGTATLDSARLDACVAALAATETNCDSHLYELYWRCLAAFQGSIPHGQPCGVSDDIGFAACDDGHCDGGTCQAYVSNGGDCSSPFDLCDYTIAESCLPGDTCGGPLDPGEACATSRNCKSLSCDVNGSGTCNVAGSGAHCGKLSG